MEQPHRAEDPRWVTRFRAGRFTTINGYHYFTTRENTLEGPFFTRSDAERASAAYINRVNDGDAED